VPVSENARLRTRCTKVPWSGSDAALVFFLIDYPWIQTRVARRAVKLAADDPERLREARKALDDAKVALGEREPV
jgi:hypothetical protein